MTKNEGRTVRVYCEQSLTNDMQLALSVAATNHLLKVMRLRPGDHFALFDGSGFDYPAELLHTKGAGVTARVGCAGTQEPPAPLNIHLALGVSKGERMDFAIQKAVELGVSQITPLWSARAVVKLTDERLARRLAHWRGIIISACEQSGRRRLPQLHPASSLNDWLSRSHPGGLLLHPCAASGFDQLPPPPAGAITLLIGPEGGLTPTERDLALQRGFTGVRLGPRTLRTETAPLAAITAAQLLWGDFRAAAS